MARRKPPTPEEVRNMHQADLDGRDLGHRFAGWTRQGFMWKTTCALCGRNAYLDPKGGLAFKVFPEQRQCDNRDHKPKEWPGVELSVRKWRVNPLCVRAADKAEELGHVLTPWSLHANELVPVAYCSCVACRLGIVADPSLPEPHQILGAACAQPCQLTEAQP